MNAYKLTTQQNNLIVADFHSFRKEECTVITQGATIISRNVPEGLAHSNSSIWNGLLNRGLVSTFLKSNHPKISPEGMQNEKIENPQT